VFAEANRVVVTIAATYTAGVFLITVFTIVRVCLALTTAELPLGNLKAMITGHEERSPT
jgi:hypothetical protein